MRWTLLPLPLMLACAPVAPDVDPTNFSGAPGGSAVSPEIQLTGAPISIPVGTLVVEPLVEGFTTRIAVYAPGATVDIYGSFRGPGAGACPASLRGACLGVRQAFKFGRTTARTSGRAAGWAVLEVTTPPGSPAVVWVQGAVLGGTPATLSAVSEQTIQNTASDTDGDGLPDALEGGFGANPYDADTDNDGLGDFEEVYAYGTLPWSRDSDSDGLGDGDEVQGYGTNPLDGDSDDDALGDLQEIQASSSGLNPDSDGDTLRDGDEVYAYGTSPVNQDSDYDAVRDDVEVAQGSNPLDVDTDHDGLWDADEAVYGGLVLDPDSDDDGLSDGDELRVWGTNLLDDDSDDDGWLDGVEVADGWDPLVADQDRDGLSDAAESSWGTDPQLADTDGDGFRDDEEVFGGTDPLTTDLQVVVHWAGPVTISHVEDPLGVFPPGFLGASGTLSALWHAPGSPASLASFDAAYFVAPELDLDVGVFHATQNAGAYALVSVFDAAPGSPWGSDGVSTYYVADDVTPANGRTTIVRWQCSSSFAGSRDGVRLPIAPPDGRYGCGGDLLVEDASGVFSWALLSVGPFVRVP